MAASMEKENEWFLEQRAIQKAVKLARTHKKLRNGTIRARKIKGKWIAFQEVKSLEVMKNQLHSDFLKLAAKFPEEWNTPREWAAHDEGFLEGQMLFIVWLQGRMQVGDMHLIKEIAAYNRDREGQLEKDYRELRKHIPKGRARKPESAAKITGVLAIRDRKKCSLKKAAHDYSVKHHFDQQKERRLYENVKRYDRQRRGV
jgi:hypothetical protein